MNDPEADGRHLTLEYIHMLTSMKQQYIFDESYVYTASDLLYDSPHTCGKWKRNLPLKLRQYRIQDDRFSLREFLSVQL